MGAEVSQVLYDSHATYPNEDAARRLTSGTRWFQELGVDWLGSSKVGVACLLPPAIQIMLEMLPRQRSRALAGLVLRRCRVISNVLRHFNGCLACDGVLGLHATGEARVVIAALQCVSHRDCPMAADITHETSSI